MAISNYSELQSSLAEWLVRSDLPAIIPTFIANAEATFRRDPRIRQLAVASLSVSAETVSLPSDFKRLESLAHNGPSEFFELDIVSPGDLSRWKAPSGSTGRPRVASIVEATNTVYFSPIPDGTYTLRLGYWKDIPTLSVGTPTNWLLNEHPDIYFYGSLVESAPYLRDDERVAIWRAEYERRVQELDAYADQAQFSGSLTKAFPGAIG